MIFPVPVTATSTVIAVSMVVGGLAVLIVGLSLLAGGRQTAARPAPPRDRPDDSPHGVPCAWTARLVIDGGEPIPLHTPAGRACCTYTLHVRDLDPPVEPVDRQDEWLSWAGDAMRISSDGAVTELLHDLLTTRLRPAGAGVTGQVSLEHGPGPTVHTSRADATVRTADDTVDEIRSPAKRLWSRHLDELHAVGARPRSPNDPPVATVHGQRRVEVRLETIHGCEPAPNAARVDVTCRAGIDGTGTAGLDAPRLRSWAESEEFQVVAATPTAPPAGIATWEPTTDGRGLTLSRAVRDGTFRGDWRDEGRAVIRSPRTCTIELGAAVDLELRAAAPDRVPRSATVRAEAATSLRLRVTADDDADRAAAAGHDAATGCRGCVPDIELRIGDLPTLTRAPRIPAAEPEHADGEILADRHRLRLRHVPPVGDTPGGWTVIARDAVPAPTSATSTQEA